jgi:hypothetical protein
MPLSAAALNRISARHARYGAILQERVKALDAQVDAAGNLPTREAQDAALVEILTQAAKLRERSRRHTARATRWVRRIAAELKAPPGPASRRPRL